MKKYDLIVIGGGGGTKLVSPPAALGLKVAVIEADKLGGTCLNHGCIPSKMLIHAADVATQIKNAEQYELKAELKDVYFEKLVSRVSNTIDDESASIDMAYEKNPNIDHYSGHARLLSNREVKVNGTVLTADKIFIPVGAEPAIPTNIEGLDRTPYMTYKEALRNTKKPKKLIVLGAGYIACELGYFYAALGVDTTFLVRSSFLKQEDEDVRKEFTKSFTEMHDVRFGVEPKKVTYENGIFTLDCGDEAFTCDALLVATGVRANTAGLGLENTDVKLDSRGYIQVDEYLKTDAPNIYCFGDAIGRKLFRHTANFEGEYLFGQLYGKEPKGPIDYSPVPHAVFSHPQIGAVGKTEKELIAEGTEYFSGLNPYASSAMGMALRSKEGFCKLLFEKKSHKLLGGHIVGDEASNMIHTVIAFITMGATLEDMLRTIYIHPALPEIIRNACRRAKKNTAA